jgi:hypothetical protein
MIASAASKLVVKLATSVMKTVVVAESAPFGKTQFSRRHSTLAAVMTVTTAMSPTGAEVVGLADVGMMSSKDFNHTGHGSIFLSNVIACENGGENGDGCCCHGVLIDKTSWDSLLKSDSGDNTTEVVGGGNEIKGI